MQKTEQLVKNLRLMHQAWKNSERKLAMVYQEGDKAKGSKDVKALLAKLHIVEQKFKQNRDKFDFESNKASTLSHYLRVTEAAKMRDEKKDRSEIQRANDKASALSHYLRVTEAARLNTKRTLEAKLHELRAEKEKSSTLSHYLRLTEAARLKAKRDLEAQKH